MLYIGTLDKLDDGETLMTKLSNRYILLECKWQYPAGCWGEGLLSVWYRGFWYVPIIRVHYCTVHKLNSTLVCTGHLVGPFQLIFSTPLQCGIFRLFKTVDFVIPRVYKNQEKGKEKKDQEKKNQEEERRRRF